MHSRDIAIVAAVVLLAGFAVADALRSDDSAPTGTGSPPATTTASDADSEDEGEGFPGLGLPGSLVFLAGDECRVRQVSVASGNEFPLPDIPTGCAFSAPPTGSRLAYAVRESGDSAGRSAFRFVSLNEPLRDLGSFDAPLAGVVWSADGQRAGWCDDAGTGFDYELGRELRELEQCPRGYTPEGQPVVAAGRRLLLPGGTTFGPAPRGIQAVRFGSDGSLALVLRGGTIERSDPRGDVTTAAVPRPIRRWPLLLSPDNCAVLGVHRDIVALVDLGCFRGLGSPPEAFVGTAATWSPDGEWIAVAEGRTIAFHRVVGEYRIERWNVGVRGLVWLG
jgi:hypothetical protein